MFVDLNCDLGEGAGTDQDVIPLITSANVSCGWHAGTEKEIADTLALCATHGIAVGAHPGHPDREHFGRRELPTPALEVLQQTLEQIDILRHMADRVGILLRYIKPHGGLYHQACRDDAYADAIVGAASLSGLPVIGLPGSRLEARASGRVPFYAEGFADRAYQTDGSLVPRTQPGAMIENPKLALEQVVRLLNGGKVRTICVHGDNPQALEFVRVVREELNRAGVKVKSFT
jgi:UPF0271 protein